MMNTKIFLEGFKGKESINTSGGLNVEFKGKRKLLPLDGIGEVLSQYDQYREEREKCSIIRLTCQINPICSNVLFNRTTDIIRDEGSSAVTYINYGLNPNGDSVAFENVLYKPKEMQFWSGGNMHYQAIDEDVFPLPADQQLTYLSATKHFTNGETISEVFHPTNAVRDSQLSRKNVGYVYHCGLDFFSNHLVRSNTFKSVCRCPKDDMGEYTAFNTIADLMRTVGGVKVLEKAYFPTSEKNLADRDYTQNMTLHLYEYDDVLTFKDSREKRLISKYNGWVGFENRPKIKSYSNFTANTSMEIERPISYMNGGDFIDMYPGRDLYSFVPKYNTYQRRIEKNWNYCLTYPSSSYTPSKITDPFSDIIEFNNGLGSLKTVYFDENTKNDNGVSQVVLYSVSKHGLSKGEYVNIYKTYKTTLYWVTRVGVTDERVSIKYETEVEANDAMKLLEIENPKSQYVITSAPNQIVSHKIADNAEVIDIYDEHTFMVFVSDLQISDTWVFLADSEKKQGAEITVNGTTYIMDDCLHFFRNKDDNTDTFKYYVLFNEYVNFDKKAQNITYKKVVNDIECEYYIRIFSKIPNFKFASADTSTSYEIYKNNEEILHTYQDRKYDFENHISRLAFAKNIYTDEIGELVFTDDIDISKLKDNLGRPLSTIYLTFIKNNKGYKEWYGWKGQVDDWSIDTINKEYENIEYSHCFGPITCGIKASYEARFDDDIRSITRIHNIATTNVGYNVPKENGERGYYDSTNHRVEIDDWEIWYDTDKHFWGDLCYYDNYNALERHVQYVEHRFNTAQRECSISGTKSRDYFNAFVYDDIQADDYDAEFHYTIRSTTVSGSNACSEGYYYIPHYDIPIKTFGVVKTIMPDFLTIRQFIDIGSSEDSVYKFTTLQPHFLTIGDKAVLYDTLQKKYYNITAIRGEDDDYHVFTCRVFDEKTDKPSKITYLNTIEEEIPIESLSTSAVMDSVRVSDFKLFKIDNLGAPDYCKPLKDGTCRIVWRDVINNGFNESDDTVEEYPFTNGAFYVNRNINIYVRRQDPYGDFKLYDEMDIEGNAIDILAEDNYIKEPEIEC